MTYTTGGLIQASDYNDFAGQGATLLNTNNVNRVWGNGTATFGYGQGGSTPIPAVVGGNTVVTASQWSTLNNIITSIASHQGTAITSRTNPVVGDTISVLAALQNDITNINLARGNSAALGSQYAIWTGPASQTTGTGSGSSAWSLTWTQRINFPTAAQANWFFNSGGLIKWQVNKTSTGTVADLAWNTFINNGISDIFITAGNQTQNIAGINYTGVTRVGGTIAPTTFLPTAGYYNLTSTPQIIYQVFNNISPYGGNNLRLIASMNGPVQMLLTTVWSSSGGSGPGSTSAITGGSDTPSPFVGFGTAPTTLVTYINPETVNLTNSWGTPTIAYDPISVG
jgi:hypothetical protein